MLPLFRLLLKPILPGILAGAIGLRLAGQVTETPQTVAPGDLLLRVNAISLGLNPDSPAPNEYRALGVAWPTVSTGITQNLDFELSAQFFLQDTYRWRL
jgi:hypothetical protein